MGPSMTSGLRLARPAGLVGVVVGGAGCEERGESGVGFPGVAVDLSLGSFADLCLYKRAVVPFMFPLEVELLAIRLCFSP